MQKSQLKILRNTHSLLNFQNILMDKEIVTLIQLPDVSTSIMLDLQTSLTQIGIQFQQVVLNYTKKEVSLFSNKIFAIYAKTFYKNEIEHLMNVLNACSRIEKTLKNTFFLFIKYNKQWHSFASFKLKLEPIYDFVMNNEITEGHKKNSILEVHSLFSSVLEMEQAFSITSILVLLENMHTTIGFSINP